MFVFLLEHNFYKLRVLYFGAHVCKEWSEASKQASVDTVILPYRKRLATFIYIW